MPFGMSDGGTCRTRREPKAPEQDTGGRLQKKLREPVPNSSISYRTRTSRTTCLKGGKPPHVSTVRQACSGRRWRSRSKYFWRAASSSLVAADTWTTYMSFTLSFNCAPRCARPLHNCKAKREKPRTLCGFCCCVCVWVWGHIVSFTAPHASHLGHARRPNLLRVK